MTDVVKIVPLHKSLEDLLSFVLGALPQIAEIVTVCGPVYEWYGKVSTGL